MHRNYKPHLSQGKFPDGFQFAEPDALYVRVGATAKPMPVATFLACGATLYIPHNKKRAFLVHRLGSGTIDFEQIPSDARGLHARGPRGLHKPIELARYMTPGRRAFFCHQDETLGFRVLCIDPQACVVLA